MQNPLIRPTYHLQLGSARSPRVCRNSASSISIHFETSQQTFLVLTDLVLSPFSVNCDSCNPRLTLYSPISSVTIFNPRPPFQISEEYGGVNGHVKCLWSSFKSHPLCSIVTLLRYIGKLSGTRMYSLNLLNIFWAELSGSCSSK